MIADCRLEIRRINVESENLDSRGTLIRKYRALSRRDLHNFTARQHPVGPRRTVRDVFNGRWRRPRNLFAAA